MSLAERVVARYLAAAYAPEFALAKKTVKDAVADYAERIRCEVSEEKESTSGDEYHYQYTIAPTLRPEPKFTREEVTFLFFRITDFIHKELERVMGKRRPDTSAMGDKSSLGQRIRIDIEPFVSLRK